WGGAGRGGGEKPNGGHCGLLRGYRKGPSNAAAEDPDRRPPAPQQNPVCGWCNCNGTTNDMARGCQHSACNSACQPGPHRAWNSSIRLGITKPLSCCLLSPLTTAGALS